MPKVSVIIPCFNQGKFIDEAVDSILGQTYKDFEIIIVNDGSTDEFTIKKLQSYSKPKTTVFHTKNLKPSAARNFGISNSVGEYILTLDGDDKSRPTFLEKAVYILDIYKEIGVVSCYLEAFGKFCWINKNFKSGGVENYIGKNNTTSFALFRRICWEQAGGYDKTMVYGSEDWNFWLGITKLGWKVHIIEEPLFMYRQNDYSHSNVCHGHIEEVIRKIIQNHYELFKENFVEAIVQREIFISKVQMSYLKTYLEEQHWYKLAKKLKDSTSYKIGRVITYPVSIFKKILKW